MLPANTKFYIDGNEMTMGSGSSSQLNFPAGTEDIFLGRFNSSSTANWWNGQISNFKLYNVALEPSEVKKLYRLGRTGRSTVITDTAVGIGIAPEAQLDVRGDLLVRGIPRTPTRPVFYAYQYGGASEANGYTGQIYFSHTRINIGGCFIAGNNAERKFYAPITGYYWFEFQVLAREGSGDGHVETTLYKNGANVSSRALAYTYLKGTADHDNLCFSVPVYMETGDNIYPGVYASDSTVNVYYGEDLGHFSGFFIG